MSSHIPITITFIFIFFIFIFSASTSTSLSTTTAKDIHDLISDYGFPKGLIPNNVLSYTLSSDNSSFIIHLRSPCYVHFSYLVYYNTQISGTISYGSVTGVSGIQAKNLFFWLPVTGIKVDRDDSGMIDFFVGALSQKLPAKQFEKVPGCSPKGFKEFGVAKLWERMWMI